jgi:hypothetical protein
VDVVEQLNVFVRLCSVWGAQLKFHEEQSKKRRSQLFEKIAESISLRMIDRVKEEYRAQGLEEP